MVAFCIVQQTSLKFQNCPLEPVPIIPRTVNRLLGEAESGSAEPCRGRMDQREGLWAALRALPCPHGSALGPGSRPGRRGREATGPAGGGRQGGRWLSPEARQGGSSAPPHPPEPRVGVGPKGPVSAVASPPPCVEQLIHMENLIF